MTDDTVRVIDSALFLLLEQLSINQIPVIVSPVFDALFCYTDALGYRLQFGPREYMVFKFQKFDKDDGWVLVLTNGRIKDVIDYLKTAGPFLTIPEIETHWPPGHLEQ